MIRRFLQLILVGAFALLAITACSSVPTSQISPVTPLPPPDATQSAAAAAGTEAVSSGQLLQGNPPYALAFDQMYSARSVRYGLTMSDYLKALNGQSTSIAGYMAPPLKSSLDFFVLTEVPMALCPFCSSNADWPDNILLVYLNGQTTKPTARPVRVIGRLEIGSQVDQATGFVSMVRLYADSLEIVG